MAIRPEAPSQAIRRCTIAIEGVVQGVGFRPFVYRLARRHHLAGSVRNARRGVVIEVEGPAADLAGFLAALPAAPAPARPERLEVAWTAPRRAAAAFVIEESRPEGRPGLLPPDLAPCPACLAELEDPADRRHRYAFLNCSACGPRFTVVRGLPYDRARTTMAAFAMCPACRAEYADPGDRRFHAEPTACPRCGPRLALTDAAGRPRPAADPVAAAAAGLAAGAIVAVKGVGGYHLAGDAASPEAVAELRRRKGREARPLAVMVADLEAARRLAEVSEAEAALLASPARPIVLLARRPGAALAPAVAPGLREVGLMLPSTPLHHLLLAAAGRPLVMTSGNRSDEPIACDDGDARARLGAIADLFLAHDRPIEARCDDSVVRVAAGAPLLLRRSRGWVPLPVRLPHPAPRPVLAVGGDLKAVFALAREGEAFLSQHLGDLGDELSWRAYGEAVARWRRRLDLEPAVVAHDLHPGYRSTAWALGLDGVERVGVQHHHAHVASCLADNGVDGPVIGVAWDGTGWGPGGRVWGGEFLVADLAGFARVGHLAEFPLPGGEAAVREPWRAAAALLAAAYGPAATGLDLDAVRRFDRAGWRVLARAVERGVNAPLTSSAGRLFDAVASLLGLRDRVTFEAQAAMELEALADGEADRPYPVAVREADGLLVVDTPAVVRGVVEDLLAAEPPARIAARFHATLAEALAAACAAVRRRTGLSRVALSGGCFQNARLLAAAVGRLEAGGFEVLRHRQVPPGDGGLALGQAAVAARRLGVPEDRG